MWRSRRNRDGSKGYETCETCALCSAGRFHVIMDDLLLSEVQIIEKNREQTKKYSGVILGSIHPKNERNYQNIGKKKKKGRKILKPAFWGRLNQVRNFYWPFLPNREQSTNFYSNQGLDFQYQRENDQECTVKNIALKSLGRWNEEGMGGN